MAKPIKETPILYGTDSDRFLKEVKKNENKKVSAKEYKKAVSAYEKIINNPKTKL